MGAEPGGGAALVDIAGLDFHPDRAVIKRRGGSGYLVAIKERFQSEKMVRVVRKDGNDLRRRCGKGYTVGMFPGKVLVEADAAGKVRTKTTAAMVDKMVIVRHLVMHHEIGLLFREMAGDEGDIRQGQVGMKEQFAAACIDNPGAGRENQVIGGERPGDHPLERIPGTTGGNDPDYAVLAQLFQAVEVFLTDMPAGVEERPVEIGKDDPDGTGPETAERHHGRQLTVIFWMGIRRSMA